MCDTKTPQGILCVVRMPEYRLEEMLEGDGGLYLILEDIQDPGKLEYAHIDPPYPLFPCSVRFLHFL